MRRFLAVSSLAGALAAGPSHAADDPVRTLPARVERDVTLSGRWRIDRDVEVPAGVTLRLAPGAAVDVANADLSKSGDFPALVEIHVRGRLVAEGTREAPVVFSPEKKDGPGRRTWKGIVLHAERSRSPDSAISGVKFLGAVEAVLVTDGSPRIENSVFVSCGVGVACGRAADAADRTTEPCVRPQPEITGCVMADLECGVFVESDAAPEISRTSFLDCGVAAGNLRLSRSFSPVRGLGARADRCLFLRNRVAVHGGGVVENSVFLKNDAALALSDFHDEFSQSIDRFAWRRNILWQNALVCDGEADIGADNLFLDPRIASEPAALKFSEAVAPLAGVSLAGDSPARGTALGGGDPGPAGAAGATRGRVWKSAARALRTVLVLGPPDRVDVKNLPRTAPAAPGERVGAAWWAAFRVEDDGALRRSALRTEAASVVLAFPWRTGGAGEPETLEVNADGRVSLWRSGTSLPVPRIVMRNGSAGVVVPLAAGAAPSVVAVWTSSDVDPRIGLALDRDAATVEDTSAPAALEVLPLRFGPRHAGFRVAAPFHWADVGRPGVVKLRTADGELHDACELGIALFDSNGTLRVELPDGVKKPGAKFVVDGLRDAAGRVFAGQPSEFAAALPE